MRAAVLAARDDLLARVAALLEVDAAEQLEVQHLRHELVDGRRLDRRRRRSAPRASASASSVDRRRRVGAALPATMQRAHAGRVRQADAARRRRARAAAHGAASPAAASAGAPARPHSADSAVASLSLHLRAQHEHRQPLQRRRPARRRAGEQDLVVGRAPDHEARQQPALGRAVAGQAAPAPAPSAAMSLVSWPCRNWRASAPWARITPQWRQRHARRRSRKGVVMRRLSSAPMILPSAGFDRDAAPPAHPFDEAVARCCCSCCCSASPRRRRAPSGG